MGTWRVIICDNRVCTGFYVDSHTGLEVSLIIDCPYCDELARGYPLDRARFAGYRIKPHETRVEYVNNHQSGDGIERKITRFTSDAFLNQVNLTLNLRYMLPDISYVNLHDCQFVSYLIKFHVHKGKVYYKTSARVCINYLR